MEGEMIYGTFSMFYLVKMAILTVGYAMLCAVDGCTIGAASFLKKLPLSQRIHAASYFGFGHAFFAMASISLITAILICVGHLLSTTKLIEFEGGLDSTIVVTTMSHLTPWALALLAYLLAKEFFEEEQDEDTSILGKPLITRLWIATLASVDSGTWGPTGQLAKLGFEESLLVFGAGGLVVMLQVVLFSYCLGVVDKFFGGDSVKLFAISILLVCICLHSFRLWVEMQTLVSPFLSFVLPMLLLLGLFFNSWRHSLVGKTSGQQNESI